MTAWWAMSSRLTIRRRSAWVVEQAAAAVTMTVARQPPRESRLEVATTGTGILYARGLVAGVTTTEAVSFADGTLPVRQTTALFTSVASVTTSGFSAQNVSVRSVGRDGSPQQALAVLVEGWPASFSEREPSRSSVSFQGRTEDGTGWWTIAFSETFELRPGDLIDDERGRRWEVLGVPRPGGANVADPHWLVRCRLREGDS